MIRIILLLFSIMPLISPGLPVFTPSHLTPLIQIKIMESIFRNVTLEISYFDFNHTFSAKKSTLEDAVDTYSKHSLELNKLFNSIFLMSVKNYFRNYTTEINNMMTKALCETKLMTFPMGKTLTLIDLSRMSDRLINLVFEAKGKRLFGLKLESTSENHRFFVWNEIIKGVIRYYLTKNRRNADFSNKLINSFNLTDAILSKWTLIEAEIQDVFHHSTLDNFIRNSISQQEMLANEVLFNVTREQLEKGIRNAKILTELQDFLRNRTQENNTTEEFHRVYAPITVIYIGTVMVLTVLVGLYVAYQLIFRRRKSSMYEKF